MNNQSVVQETVGTPKVFVLSTISGSKTPEETLQSLDKYGIERFVSEEGKLMIKSWTVAADDFVTPEQAAIIRSNTPSSECRDDLDWLSKNLESVREEFGNRWIAIYENRVVGSATKLPELMSQVEKFDKPLITFIPSEPTTWISTYAS